MGSQLEGRTITTTCVCSDPGHLMTFGFDIFKDKALSWEVPDLYVHVQLNPKYSVLARCAIALQYVLGKHSRFGWGHWDSGCIDLKSATELRVLLDDYIAAVRG